MLSGEVFAPASRGGNILPFLRNVSRATTKVDKELPGHLVIYYTLTLCGDEIRRNLYRGTCAPFGNDLFQVFGNAGDHHAVE